MSNTIRIICDAPNPRHPKRHPKPVIEVFTWEATRLAPDGRWTPIRGVGVSLDGNELAAHVPIDVPGLAWQRGGRRHEFRNVYELKCKFCDQPQVFTLTKLVAALDSGHSVGRTVLTLAELSAIVQSMASSEV